jgi:hypothetical protein
VLSPQSVQSIWATEETTPKTKQFQGIKIKGQEPTQKNNNKHETINQNQRTISRTTTNSKTKDTKIKHQKIK